MTVIEDARERGEEIGGDAFRAVKEADRLTATGAIMKNVVDGYPERQWRRQCG